MFTIASSRLGNSEAQSALGHTFYYGLGVEKNCQFSRIYFLRSCRKCMH